jgi:hypothetical protein
MTFWERESFEDSKKISEPAGWLIPPVPATGEVEVRGLQFEASTGKLAPRLYLKNN